MKVVDNLLFEEEFLNVIWCDMVKFVYLQLCDESQVEDVVQEVLMVVVVKVGEFVGCLVLKIWVFVILKNKIVDLICW